ncbi:hypothetical protein D9758_013844 [Tetrapyrgos nigripes]|uniref:Uncharacterized protein n=1 Tax=Tetrapyrgos nigripes TaxID=182062 RepID=A0A8H5FT65_9AGAR|nr:hypothetical protein D9758_013844 [Tetrapyrgos nigripes]
MQTRLEADEIDYEDGTEELEKGIYEAVKEAQDALENLEINGGDDDGDDAPLEPAPTRRDALQAVASNTPQIATNPFTKSHKKGKGKSEHSDPSLELVKGKKSVVRVITIDEAPEVWPIPHSDTPIAYILDLNGKPECLSNGDRMLTVDGFIKKECQDAWGGDTGTGKFHCFVGHRGVQNLKTYISEEDFKYLKSFPDLDSDLKIAQYASYCDAHPHEKVQAWWRHKESYPWLLSSLNRHLSLMDPSHWDIVPANTNMIEGSHAQDNQVTGIQHTLPRCKQFDDDTARTVLASKASSVLSKSNNTVLDHFKAREVVKRLNASARNYRSWREILLQSSRPVEIGQNNCSSRSKVLRRHESAHQKSLPAQLLLLVDLLHFVALQFMVVSVATPSSGKSSLGGTGTPMDPVLIDFDIPAPRHSADTPSLYSPLRFSVPGTSNYMQTPLRKVWNRATQLSKNADNWDWETINAALAECDGPAPAPNSYYFATSPSGEPRLYPVEGNEDILASFPAPSK